MHDSVGIERRAGARHVEAEVEAFAGRRLGHRALHLARALDRHSVLLGQAFGAVALAFGRGGGIELEAPPRHLHVVAVLELSQGGLEAALADVAPRTGDVRPDFYVHQFQGSSARCFQYVAGSSTIPSNLAMSTSTDIAARLL